MGPAKGANDNAPAMRWRATERLKLVETNAEGDFTPRSG
jgi:hypothetical protein